MCSVFVLIDIFQDTSFWFCMRISGELEFYIFLQDTATFVCRKFGTTVTILLPSSCHNCCFLLMYPSCAVTKMELSLCLGTEPESTPEEEDMEEQQASGQAPARQESIEQILWQIEALQARVEKSKHQLSRGAPLRRSPASSTLSPRGPSQAPVRASSSSPLTLPKNSPAPSTGTPPVLNSGTARAGTGSGLARRKASDYDISNMVMPVNVGAKYVEQVRHEDIETPQWRLVDSLAQSHEQISSDEVGIYSCSIAIAPDYGLCVIVSSY